MHSVFSRRAFSSDSMFRLLISAALLWTCPPLPAGATDPDWIVRGRHGLVAADSLHASQAGVEVLKQGGNAIDAAVAVSFALAVTRPDSTGLGGGGFMIARMHDGAIIVQDFRETAPAAATADMFTSAATTDGPSPSEVGFLAAGVPGLVAGRCAALPRFGTMPLSRVLAPAIRLANEGFPVDAHYVEMSEEVLKSFKKHPALKETCRYLYETHLQSGHLRAVGDKLVQPALGKLLTEIATNGPDFFYRGPFADALVSAMQRHGGIITKNDLADYAVKERTPLRFTYRGYDLITMPPPSSGGIALAESLQILEKLDFAAFAKGDPQLALHYLIEAMKHAFADRARWLGDADFADVPLDFLLSGDRAAKLAARIKPDRVSPLDDYGATTLPDDAGTSHFCIVDRKGNVVVSTETINTEFGALVAVDEWGVILNNEMDDFAAQPGKPNAFGLIQSARNAVAPGKKPLSSMVPTIVLKDDSPHLLIGASGGPRIITSTLNVLLGVTDYDLSLEQAMLHLRPHHQWRPDAVTFDAAPPSELAAALTQRGHQLSEKRGSGDVQAILKSEDGWIAASDPRKGGRPAAE